MTTIKDTDSSFNFRAVFKKYRRARWSIAGTPLENEVRSTLNYLADCGIVSALEESDDVYYIMANTQVDAERMEKILEQMRREKSFDAIIGDNTYDAAKSFKPTDYLKYRLDVRTISPTKFLRSTHANFHAEDNRIAAFYIFDADEDEQGKVAQTIQKIFELFAQKKSSTHGRGFFDFRSR